MLLSGNQGNSPLGERNTTRLVTRPNRDAPLLALINPTQGDVEFKLPAINGISWVPVLNSLAPHDIKNDTCVQEQTVTLGYHAMIVYEGVPTPKLCSVNLPNRPKDVAQAYEETIPNQKRKRLCL